MVAFKDETTFVLEKYSPFLSDRKKVYRRDVPQIKTKKKILYLCLLGIVVQPEKYFSTFTSVFLNQTNTQPIRTTRLDFQTLQNLWRDSELKINIIQFQSL